MHLNVFRQMEKHKKVVLNKYFQSQLKMNIKKPYRLVFGRASVTLSDLFSEGFTYKAALTYTLLAGLRLLYCLFSSIGFGIFLCTGSLRTDFQIGYT